MKRTFSLLLACCIGITTVTAQSSAEAKISAPVRLKKLALKPGQQFEVINQTKTQNSMEMMGQTIDINADANSTYLTDIKSAKEKGWNTTSMLTKLSTNSTIMGQNMSYDSEKPEDKDSEIGKVLSPEINKATEADITEDGNIVKAAADAGKDSKAESNPMLDMIKNNQDQNPGINDFFLLIPENAKTGDSWSDSVIVTGVKTYRTFTIKSVQGDEVVVALSGKQSISRTIDNNGMEVNVNLENKVSGEITVNSSTSVVKQKSYTLDGTGTSEVMGQSIPMTTKATINVTVTTK